MNYLSNLSYLHYMCYLHYLSYLSHLSYLTCMFHLGLSQILSAAISKYTIKITCKTFSRIIHIIYIFRTMYQGLNPREIVDMVVIVETRNG